VCCGHAQAHTCCSDSVDGSDNPTLARLEMVKQQLADMTKSLRGLADYAEQIEADVEASDKVSSSSLRGIAVLCL